MPRRRSILGLQPPEQCVDGANDAGGRVGQVDLPSKIPTQPGHQPPECYVRLGAGELKFRAAALRAKMGVASQPAGYHRSFSDESGLAIGNKMLPKRRLAYAHTGSPGRRTHSRPRPRNLGYGRGSGSPRG